MKSIYIDLQNDADDFIDRCASFNEMMRMIWSRDAEEVLPLLSTLGIGQETNAES